MTLATIKGRLQTKVLTYAIAGPSAMLFATIEDCTVYYTMFVLLITIGLMLESIWGLLISHEPGWLTIVLATIEFSLIFGVVKFLQLDIYLSQSIAEFHEGLRFYVITWVIIQFFLIYLLPIWRPSWIQDGRELW